MSEKISSKGFNFKKEPLSENNLPAAAKVMYRNKFYESGNRRHGEVELFRNGMFVRTCSMKNISLVRS